MTTVGRHFIIIAVFLTAVLSGAEPMSPQGADNPNAKDANVSRHLKEIDRINLGSFYTPSKYVKLSGVWLQSQGIDKNWTIADLACGYGAFFALMEIPSLSKCRFMGNDIDPHAISIGRTLFSNVTWSVTNTLTNITREKFNLQKTEPLILVGNPPYNDVTSQTGKQIKQRNFEVDADVKSRDLGISFLLAYNKLRADYVIVLHPLSYLIKKANYRAATPFFSNYQLINHIVFPSSEFAGTSKASVFPVIVAFYKRSEGHGITMNDVRSFTFKTVDGNQFAVENFDYMTDIIAKYPHKKRYSPEILFYTLRDINALKRSRTFLPSRIDNAVDIDPNLLSYYCYIDCFKRYAEVPYYLGNFDIPYDKENFNAVSNQLLSVAKYHHPEIFGKVTPPQEEAIKSVKEYIHRSLNPKKKATQE